MPIHQMQLEREMKSVEILRALRILFFTYQLFTALKKKKQPSKTLLLSYHLFVTKEKTEGDSYLICVVDTSHRLLLSATNSI